MRCAALGAGIVLAKKPWRVETSNFKKINFEGGSAG
jgi:hypothetical protein